MANILGFVGIAVSGFALLFAIIAVALGQWQTLEVGSTKTTAGLWDYCIESGGNKACTDINSDNIDDDELVSNYQAVRAMVILGLMLSAGAIVAAILVLFVMKSTNMLFFVAGGLDIVAGLFLMIGMAIYVDKVVSDNFDFGAAFALDIVAWIAAWAGGGIFMAAKMMDTA